MTGKNGFSKLFSPLNIGGVRLKNRLLKTTSSMGYQDARKDYFISQRYIDFTEAIARGGVGMIVAEGGILDFPLGAHDHWFFCIDGDEYIPGWAKLADVCHKYDCKLFAQVIHAGPWHKPVLSGFKTVPVASSDNIQVEEGGEPSPTRALSIPEIEALVEKFVLAAERYKKAGLDGVEINASGNHLLNSFLSRAFNSRHDEYGCDTFENRSRILMDILNGIKGRLGYDFPVGVLINGVEYGVRNGLTIEETQSLSRVLEKAGANYMHVRVDGIGKYLSSHYPELIHYPEPPQPLGEMLDGSRHGVGGYVPVIAAIKKVVKIPVIAVGRLDPVLGEQLLQDGKADLIGMTKRLLADPQLPNKVQAGRLEDITPCTACEHCISFRIRREPVRCRINAALSTIGDYEIKPAEKKKKVVVVGGGPGGMEAARVAALRGHDVVLYEKGNKLGGLIPMAGIVKGFDHEELDTIVKYLQRQIGKIGVKIQMNKAFTADIAETLKPDTVILSVGSKPTVPEIPGIDGKNVLNAPDLHRKIKSLLRYFGPKFIERMTKLWLPIGKRAVILGGTMHGFEVAEFLVKRGRKVTIIAGNEELADGMPRRKQQRLIEWLEEKGAAVITEAHCELITPKGVKIVRKDGKIEFIEADTVLPTPLPEPDTELFDELNGKVPELYTIGDCAKGGLIIDAIADAWHTAGSV